MEVASRAPTGLEIAKLLASRCQICKRNDSDSAIVPCGHIVGCKKCLENCAITKCPSCMQDKQGVLKVYQSGDNDPICRSSLNRLRVSNKVSDFKCSICFINESNIAIRPCGHICGCKECLDTLTITACPICRANKTGILKILQVKEVKPQVQQIPQKQQKVNHVKTPVPRWDRPKHRRRFIEPDSNPPPRGDGECIIL
jgi:hypothetical protein